MSRKTVLDDETMDDVRKPRMYAAIIINDDYTPMEFVTAILQQIFNKNGDDAESIMLAAHQNGKATVDIYTKEVAETKVHHAVTAAKQYKFPFKAFIEPV